MSNASTSPADASDGDRCGAECRDGSPCRNYPVDDGDRCRLHGGESTGPTDSSKLEGNQSATTHGLHADPADLLDHLAENKPQAFEWIEKKHDSYLSDAPFEAGTAKADQLKQVCALEYTIWTALGIQIRGGVIVDDPEFPGADGLGGMRESPVNLPLDRQMRTVNRRLSDLGVFERDDETGTVTQSKAEALRELMERADALGTGSTDTEDGADE